VTAGSLQLQPPAIGHEPLTPTAVRELLERQSVLLRLTLHELRRPLGVAGGYLSMIQEGSLGPAPESPQAQQGLAAMAGALQEMGSLIDGLAAVAMQEDRASLHRRPSRLRMVAASAVAAVEHQARSRQVVVVQTGPDVEVEVDAERLRVALVNLIANAIRHSPAGATVQVGVQLDANAMTITVRDDGPGIRPSDAAHIFDPWYQGSGASSGLGLGLWIVRRIVEWHGGQVTLTSMPGQGATFCVVLPCSGDIAGSRR
jgi:signal transduction histidine kinase